MSKERVVVTGIGIVSAIGAAPDACFDALIEGRSAISALPDEIVGESGIVAGGFVSDFDAGAVVGRKNVRRTSRYLQLTILAARRAFADAGLAADEVAPHRIGNTLGSAIGGLVEVPDSFSGFQRAGLRGVSPYTLPAAIHNMAPGMAAIDAGAKGPCYSVSASWASGACAIADAFGVVRRGSADVVMTGGADACLSPFVLSLFARGGMFATGVEASEGPSRPFDRQRMGLVPAEGAVVLTLESLTHARRRGAQIYAELSGVGSTYAPTPGTTTATQVTRRLHCMQAAMHTALQDAHTDAGDVDYVNAYGSGDPVSDRLETESLKGVFGPHAESLWVSSNKGAVGHMLGASSAFSTAMTAMSLKRGAVPPTLNLTQPDPECDLDYVPEGARERRLQTTLVNTCSESGHNVALVLKAAPSQQEAA